MKYEEKLINVIFDAAKGRVDVESREAACNRPLGTLPQPTRTGYRFDGWYWNGERVTEETVIDTDSDVRLIAAWSRERGARAFSMLRRQKIAIVALSLVAVLMVVILIAVNYVTSIYGLDDVYVIDGVEYTDHYLIRKKDGVYALYDRDGNRMTENQDGNFIAAGSGNQYKIDGETGAWELYLPVDYDSELGESTKGIEMLIVPQITEKEIYSIEVNGNVYDPYSFYRKDDSLFYLEGYEDSFLSYNLELFSKLCVGTGYLPATRLDLSSQEPHAVPRLEDGSVDLSAYGLVDRYDEDGNLIYTPLTCTVTGAKVEKQSDGSVKLLCDAEGNPMPDPNRQYTIRIGDITLGNDGCYVQLVGREHVVYVINAGIAGYLKATAMQPVEALISPCVFYPMSLSDILAARSFSLGQIVKNESTAEGEKPYRVDTTVSFIYLDMKERLFSLYGTRPYLSTDELMAGYEVNDENASEVLVALYNLQYMSCKKLGVSEEDLPDYGIGEHGFYIAFDSCVRDSNGDVGEYLTNRLLISKLTPQGTYYIYSELYDMIVEVDKSYMVFLEWSVSNWYDPYLFKQDISNVSDLAFQFGDKSYSFQLDSSYAYMYYQISENKMQVIDLFSGGLYRNADGSLSYRDSAGVKHAVVALDFANGDLKIKIRDVATNSISYEPYEKFRLTIDRNGTQTLAVNRGGVETPYVLSEITGGENVVRRKYTLVYCDPSGVELDVLAPYTDSNNQRKYTYYLLPFWQEVETEKGVYEWRRSVPTGSMSDLYMRDSEGRMYTFSGASANMRLFCDQYTGGINAPNELDYTIVNGTKQVSAVDNFRKLYVQLLSYCMEGDIDKEDFEAQTGMSIEEYIATHDCDASFSYRTSDMAKSMNMATYAGSKDPLALEEKLVKDNNERRVIVRFYEYSDRRSIVTVELLGEGDTEGDPANTVGRFYVLSDYLALLEDSVERLLAGELIED